MEAQALQVKEYNQQGQVLYALGKYEAAMELYKKAEEEDPMHIATYINMAEVFITSENYEDAKKVLNKILLIDKKNGEVYFHLGNVAFLEREIDQARSYYTKALNSGFKNATVLFHLASLYMDAEEYETALFYLNKTIKEDPFHTMARLRKIELLVAMERYQEALKNADELIEVRPNTFEGYHYKFITLLGLERLEECNQVLEAAMELFPDDLGFVYDKIKYYEHMEDYEKALELIDERFKESKEDWKSIRKEKAKLLVTMQNLEEAKALLEEIVAEEFDGEMYYVLMQLYGGYSQFDKALECCEKLVKEQEEDEYYFAAVYYEAMCYKKMNMEDKAKQKFEDAATLFRFATSKYPGNIVLYLYRALCYKEIKQYDKAFEMIDYIINVTDGQLGEAYYVRAEIYREINELEKAKADEQKAMTLSKTLQDIIL